MKIDFILFDGFETLDAMGPAEVFGRMAEAFDMAFYSPSGGLVPSAQGVAVDTRPWEAIAPGGTLLIPGGMGTRRLVGDIEFIQGLTELVNGAADVLTVCTGSALLARTEALDGRQATSNKLAFDWARSQGSRVLWQPKARWVRDGRFWTSSGISAGIDMALAYVAQAAGPEAAERCTLEMEYRWNSDPGDDPFEVLL